MNVLIVDDEKIERDALQFILQKSQLAIDSIYQAENGKSAMEICLQKHIDIIILDINMPGMNGLEFLDAIRSGGNRSKVLISTAYSQFDYAVRALQNGAVDFLVKPLSEEILISSMEKTIKRIEEEQKATESIKQMSEYLKVPEQSLSPLKPEDEDDKTTFRVKSYVASHYADRIGLEEIATDCGYSKFTINKIFKTKTGTTVVNYLIKFRIEKAKELLSMTKEPVRIIAFRVGYSDPNYFMWTFKKQEGISPLQYRAKMIAERNH